MGQENIDGSSAVSADSTAAACDRSAAKKTVRRRRQTFSSLYKRFRRLGLSKLDSAFNALYICQTERLTSQKVDVHHVGDGFFDHPVGWFKDREERVRRSSRTKTLRALEALAKILSPFSKSVEPAYLRSGFYFDNSPVALRAAARFFKKALPSCIAVLCGTILFFTIYINSQKDTVVEFSVDGVVVGEVASVKTVDEALLRVNSKISSITGEAFSFPYEISYKIKDTGHAQCMDINTVYDLLYGYTDEYLTEGYGLYIDSVLIAVLDSREDILSVLEAVKNENMKLTGEDQDIANKVEIKYQEYSPDSKITAQELLSKFSITQTEIVEEEEPVEALLSPATSLATLSLSEATPEIKQKLQEALSENGNDAIVLDFEVYYEETVRETVSYNIEYIEDDMFYEGQEFVQISGRDGLADNTYRVKYINGEEAGRELVSQSFIRKARDKVVKVGTRPLPEKMTEAENGGKYMINPVPTAMISDHYGWRILRGRSDYHEGFDLAAWKGTPIYAAASGEVIYAGYNQSYGYVVKLRHADGLITIYAHCSELFVETGDMVEQAQEIGSVGATGDATGYHLHLEVVKDGEKVDPELYIYSVD